MPNCVLYYGEQSNQLYHIGPLLTVLITGSLCHAVVEKHELLCTVVDALLEKLWLPADTQIGAGGAGCGRGWVWTDIYQVTVCGVTRLKRADESCGVFAECCFVSTGSKPPSLSNRAPVVLPGVNMARTAAVIALFSVLLSGAFAGLFFNPDEPCYVRRSRPYNFGLK